MSQIDMSPEGLGLSSEDLGPKTLIAALAEGIATLLFVFLGAGAVVAVVNILGNGVDGGGLVAIALAHGFAIALLVGATAGISGGHINPAVTFSLVITGKIKAGPGIIYIAAQLIGAVIGAFLLQLVLAEAVEGNLGANTINEAAVDGTTGALIIEIILTFVLVFTVFATAVDVRGPAVIAPLAIGLAVLVDHFIGVPTSGASMNPARSFGPALVANEWDDQWVYWVGPLIGGALAGLLYVLLFMRGASVNDPETSSQRTA